MIIGMVAIVDYKAWTPLTDEGNVAYPFWATWTAHSWLGTICIYICTLCASLCLWLFSCCVDYSHFTPLLSRLSLTLLWLTGICTLCLWFVHMMYQIWSYCTLLYSLVSLTYFTLCIVMLLLLVGICTLCLWFVHMMYQIWRFVLSTIHKGQKGGTEVGKGGGNGGRYAEQWHTFLGHSVYATGGWITHIYPFHLS